MDFFVVLGAYSPIINITLLAFGVNKKHRLRQKKRPRLVAGARVVLVVGRVLG